MLCAETLSSASRNFNFTVTVTTEMSITVLTPFARETVEITRPGKEVAKSVGE